MNCYDFAALLCDIIMDMPPEDVGCAHLYDEVGIESELPGVVVHTPDGDKFLVDIRHIPKDGIE